MEERTNVIRDPKPFCFNFDWPKDVDKNLKHEIRNIRKQYKNNKLNIAAPTWNDEFELPDSSYSVSDIQDCTEYIIKKNETLTKIPPIDVYINRINKGLVFKIKDGNKLELQTPETVKLFSITKKLIGKTKIGEK